MQIMRSSPFRIRDLDHHPADHHNHVAFGNRLREGAWLVHRGRAGGRRGSGAGLRLRLSRQLARPRACESLHAN